ncbi:histidine phosphatase superfamily [Microdochium trichocladiopsis]|uniref:Histidine phosphatase superfamily n=1 Tax=Microdochium trichocladiopsis TaxID=1682393 RepID=A0A9P8YFC7_9PEZI|nr:histidine phosphatase superfamily [Microdochium trichocladiopsis]KAH7037897.1 histidine phosphatase superfamily [Microdochium trichocladiopsis]
MSLEVIYVVRHGFRTSWVVDPGTGKYSLTIRSPTGIANDPPLTSHGIDQSRELAAHLIKIQPPVDQVYSSPYYRCMQTIQPFVDLRNGASPPDTEMRAQPLSGEAPFTIRADGGISEWFGAAHFEHPSFAPLEVLEQYFPAVDETYTSAVTRPPNGESATALHLRVAEAMRAIIARSNSEGKRAILLCSHAATVIALGRVLTGRIPSDLEEDDFKAFTCGLSVYRVQPRDVKPDEASFEQQASGNDWTDGLAMRGGWECEANSDCSFLSHGPERGWRFSVDESIHETNGGQEQYTTR